MSPFTQPGLHTVPWTRRQALQSMASGFGWLAFSGLAHQAAAGESANTDPLAPKLTHFAPRANRVIFLCMNGGPSHMDLFDYKPLLNQHAAEGKTINGEQYGARLMGAQFPFQQRGESGVWISDACPRLAEHADDLCLIHSMQTDLPNHSQAFGQMHTGSFQFVRPSIGAWTLYGLGTENANLPGFVTLNPPSDNGGAQNYGSAFLPSIFQGTKIGTNQIPGFYAAFLGINEEPGPPLRNVDNPHLSRSRQRDQLDLVRDFNARKLAQDVNHPEIEGAIESFELAFRMQDTLPDLLDLSGESAATLEQYGIGPGRDCDRFGRQCLLARRLAEAGVRFIEVTSPVGWDHHFMLKDKLAEATAATDQPVAALLADLKQRGMLNDTLVVWAGEFGRTPYAQSGTGRDHNNKGYTVWMAGGGVRGGFSFGATDDYGNQAVENAVHIHDWHATMLHLLGLDHERLTYNYAGRSFRLTNVYGRVVNEIIA
ncbi:MAG: DUF1501 domain-containing protein [Planctomycetaceae bacterium]|nr:DUF1501 domain-containing protein [Planctomycetaceae bacterium]